MIGIIVAVEEELNEIVNIMQNIEIEHILDLTLYKGIISNKICIVALSKVGKVNAARTTQIIIDNYNIEMIINYGVAGSCSTNLSIGDIVIASKLYQHDFDISVFNHKIGYIPKIGNYLECPKEILKKLKEQQTNSLSDFKIHIGSIVSGDQFISDKQTKLKLHNDFSALCCDMESAAIAQTCFLSKKNFLIIRSISDTINNNIKDEYNEFLISSSKIGASFVERYLKIL